MRAARIACTVAGICIRLGAWRQPVRAPVAR